MSARQDWQAILFGEKRSVRNLSVVVVLLLVTGALFGQTSTSNNNPSAIQVPSYSSSLPDSPSTLIASSGSLDPLPKAGLEPAPAGFIGVTPRKEVKTERPNPLHSKAWWTMTAAEHGAALFDAWTTRQAIGRGAVELNPMLKPFANSAAIYPAAQIFPAGMDFLSAKLMRSEHPFLRKLWWLPQTASAIGSVAAGIHNETVLRQ